jgi:hypothetical protein
VGVVVVAPRPSSATMASRWSSTPDCSLYDTSSATAAATRRSVTSSRCTWDVGSRSPSLMTSTRAVSGSTALLSATEGASRCRRVATVASTASTSTAPSARAARHNARPRMCNGEQSVALRTPERTTEGARKARLHLTMRRVCKMSQRVHRMRGARARGTGSGSRPRQMHARTPVGATSARTVPTDTAPTLVSCRAPLSTCTPTRVRRVRPRPRQTTTTRGHTDVEMRRCRDAATAKPTSAVRGASATASLMNRKNDTRHQQIATHRRLRVRPCATPARRESFYRPTLAGVGGT